MTEERILVAGIGNIFFGDDGFGCEVAQRLARRELRREVRVVDFGIRGLDLAYALLEQYHVTIFLDATPRGGAPGTIYVIEPDFAELDKADAAERMLNAHGMDFVRVMGLAKSLGGGLNRILIVGCEPATTGDDEGHMGLSEPVQRAVDEAVGVVESLITKELESRLDAGSAVSDAFGQTD